MAQTGAERAREWRLKNPERDRENHRRWVEKNRERTRANARRYKERHPDYARAKELKRKYDLVPEQYDAIAEAQDWKCAICRQPETALHASGQVRLLSVDHDHATGRIRGLLCRDCNIALGWFRDDPERIAAAARYLSGKVN